MTALRPPVLRPPVVAGVGGGVGTTTVAVALRGQDGGTARLEVADVVVCRATRDSLRRAEALLERDGTGPRPVVAVTLDGPRLPHGLLRTLLLELEPAAGAVVPLPLVLRWATLADPLPEVAALLVGPAARLPRGVRAYVAALRQLAAAVTASGRLGAPRTPAPATGGAGHPLVPQPDGLGPVRTTPSADLRIPLVGTAPQRSAPPVRASGRAVAAGRTPPRLFAPAAEVARPVVISRTSAPPVAAAPIAAPPVAAPPVAASPAPPPPVPARPAAAGGAAPPIAAVPLASSPDEPPGPGGPRPRRRGVRIISAAPAERAG